MNLAIEFLQGIRLIGNEHSGLLHQFATFFPERIGIVVAAEPGQQGQQGEEQENNSNEGRAGGQQIMRFCSGEGKEGLPRLNGIHPGGHKKLKAFSTFAALCST